MAVMKMSDLDRDGERVKRLFADELRSRGRAEDAWSIQQNGDGVFVRHSAALPDDEPLVIGAEDLRVLKVPDYTVTDAIRLYLDLVLAADRT